MEHNTRKQRVLVVEDEPNIVEVLTDYLTNAGYDVISASDGLTALRLVRHETPDIVVLDIMLPGGMDGLEICQRIRRNPVHLELPIIMLTARVDVENRLEGLKTGADDYITKPFSPREVVARVETVLRRSEGIRQTAKVFEYGDLLIDMDHDTVTRAGESIKLTPTEFDILAALVREPGRIFSRSQLVEAIYDIAYEGYDRAIDSHIKNLRQKIEVDPRKPVFVLTVYGKGYQFAHDS